MNHDICMIFVRLWSVEVLRVIRVFPAAMDPSSLAQSNLQIALPRTLHNPYRETRDRMTSSSQSYLHSLSIPPTSTPLQ